jgi:hypothetical protein
MLRIDTVNSPRSGFVRDTEPAACVRVYRNSPDTVVLQIWNGRRYLLVHLLPVEARGIALQLNDLADEVQ